MAAPFDACAFVTRVGAFACEGIAALPAFSVLWLTQDPDDSIRDHR
jgi:hypothetical protein